METQQFLLSAGWSFVCVLSFYSSCCHTFDKVSLETDKQDKDRDDREYRSYNQKAVVISIWIDQCIQTNRQCVLL